MTVILLVESCVIRHNIPKLDYFQAEKKCFKELGLGIDMCVFTIP